MANLSPHLSPNLPPNLPQWRHNFLACYPVLLQRLQNVAGVKKVLEAKDLQMLTGDRRQRPLDGAVYVIFDGFTPKADNNKRREQLLELGFSIILTKTNITLKPCTDGVGETLTAIAKSLQGFEPKDEHGSNLTLTPFKQKPALPIRYEDGFAYFALRYVTDVAILAED